MIKKIVDTIVNNNILGLRTIKTVLAVMISVFIMTFIFDDTPFFACIGAVASMDKTIAHSIKSALIRNIGTIGGGIIGIIMIYITNNIYLLALGLIPFIILNNWLDKQDSIVPGAIVYFAVVYFSANSAPLNYGVQRIMGTLIGSLIALAVNYFIFKPKVD